MVTHVLFDFDGTLINSVDHLYDLVDELIKEKDPALAITEVIRDYVPNLVSLDALCHLINSTLSLDIEKEYFKVAVLTRLVQRDLKLMPGVERLVTHLYEHKVPIAVSSGTLKPYYDKAISYFGDFFPKHFSHAVCAFDDEGVKRKKPAPDAYLVAAERFANPPADMSTVLVFEDSFTGLDGATESGARVVLVTRETKPLTYPQYAQFLAKTELVIDSLENFVPEQFGLPPY